MKIIILLALLTVTHVQADGKPTRSKVIDFEGDMIEGMNRLPLDSVSQISENKNGKAKAHLYQKRKSFGSENARRLHELRYLR